jgi:SAM-dependent methyltransferase
MGEIMAGKNVRKFYDTYGWKSETDCGRYLNDKRYGPPDTPLKDEKGCEARYWSYFDDGGRLFLDAGCGAKPITQIGHKFQRHVCVDISLTGLTEARRKLGKQGLYVVADLSALPFKDQVFDGVIASYCLYQIENDAQVSAVREFYRVVQENKIILVFYVAKNSLISVAHRLVKAVMRIRPRSGNNGTESIPPPEFYAQSPFRLGQGFPSVDITCLRTLSRVESHILRKLGLLETALRLFSFLERKFPHAMLWVGAYAAIRIQKTD